MNQPENSLAWLEEFFGHHNRLRLEDLRSQQAPTEWLELVQPWLDALELSKAGVQAGVLPVLDTEGSVNWYSFAQTEEIWNQLQTELLGFVGPSYSNVESSRGELNESDPIECVLIQQFGRRVRKIVPVNASDEVAISQAIASYRSVLSRRPIVPSRAQRPFGRIRRDFDVALLALNEGGASKFAEELFDTGRVDSEQKATIQIRLLAGLGRYSELALNGQLIRSVIDLALPPQTIADLLVALHKTFLGDDETHGTVREVSARFQERIGRPYARLFRERKGIRSGLVLRCFLLFEAGQFSPNIARCEAILEAYARNEEGFELACRWLDELRERHVDSSRDARADFSQAILDEDYDLALRLALESLPEGWAYGAILRCAAELRSEASKVSVLLAFGEADPSIVQGLAPRDAERLSLIRDADRTTQPAPPRGWLDWAMRVRAGLLQADALRLLESSVGGWNVCDYVAESGLCREFSDEVLNAGPADGETFRQALPQMASFFIARPVQTFLPIYGMLIRSIAWSGAVSADELELVDSLTRVMLEIGAPKANYIDLVDDLEEILTANRSPIKLDWALNVAEILAIHSSQNEEARLRFFMKVVSIARELAHRISSPQFNVLKTLSLDFNCPSIMVSWPPPSDEARDERSRQFTGLIGIYTMTQGAGARACSLLRAEYPEASVEANADSVATDSLTLLAKNAVVFVFAWRSSKHQAYYCVKEARRGRDIVLPSGKGTASIVRSAIEYIETHDVS